MTRRRLAAEGYYIIMEQKWIIFLYRINRLRPPETRLRPQAYKLLSRGLERGGNQFASLMI
jgi:hypothetical protein